MNVIKIIIKYPKYKLQQDSRRKVNDVTFLLIQLNLTYYLMFFFCF